MKCTSCGAEIFFARTMRGRRLPLNAAPDPGRGEHLMAGGTAVHLRASAPEERRYAEEAAARNQPRYLTHYATCPQAGQHRKRAEVAP